MGTKSLACAALTALCFVAACSDTPTTAPLSAPAASAKNVDSGAYTGERMSNSGHAVLNPIYDWDLGAGHPLIFGARPTGPARWPTNPNPNAQTTLYVVVYPIGTTVTDLQCYDVPLENCPDHGPTIAGGAMQFVPGVYGGGTLGHDHLGPNHGSGAFQQTAYAVLVLFTSPAFANEHLTTKAQVEAAVAAGRAILIPAVQFSFHNSLVSESVWDMGTPWICPAYTTCEP